MSLKCTVPRVWKGVLRVQGHTKACFYMNAWRQKAYSLTAFLFLLQTNIIPHSRQRSWQWKKHQQVIFFYFVTTRKEKCTKHESTLLVKFSWSRRLQVTSSQSRNGILPTTQNPSSCPPKSRAPKGNYCSDFYHHR